MADSAAPRRLQWLDAARGLSLVAMFFYHLAWDLGFFGLIDPNFPESPPFKWYGHVIAASFFALAGYGQGLALRRPAPWRRFGRRLALLMAAAAAISLSTYVVFPHDFIYFGMLHCLAAGSLALLAFRRVPVALIAAAAFAALAAPLLVAAPALDAPAFWWLGLGTRLHRSVDVRPFLPWFGVMLLGLAVSRAPAPSVSVAPRAPALNGLAAMGRHSLAIYLLHQPAFLALIYAFVWTGAATAPPAGFAGRCEASCRAAGQPADRCAAGCGCLVGHLKRKALWPRAQTGEMDEAGRRRVSQLALACSRRRP